MSTGGSTAVIGGGPGAAAAALTMARGGASVTIFRPQRAVEKPCGGAFPASQMPTLEGFDLDSLPSMTAAGFLLENAGGGRVVLDDSQVKVVRRGDLDEALVQAAVRAGCELVEEKVTALEPDRGRVQVSWARGRRGFRWCVGGDGARGVSRRSLGPVGAGDSLGVGASIDGVQADRLVLSFPNVVDSYLWIFPRPGGASVGVAYTASRLSAGAARALLRRFLDRHLAAGASVLDGVNLYRYPIPVYSSATRRTIEQGLSRRLLLVGDAAGVADPLTREGIRYAVLSGVFAGESLLADDPAAYPRRLTARLDAELSRAHRARRLFFEDSLAQWMVPAARLHPRIRTVLGNLLGGSQTYRGLRRRLLLSAFGF